MLRILMLTLVVVAVLIGTVALIGYMSPESYKGQLTETFDEKIQVVWNTTLDLRSYKYIKRDVDDVEIIAGPQGYARWREVTGKNSYRELKILERIEPVYLVVEITESTNGLTGVWTYNFEQLEKGTRVTVAEESRITNVLTRGIQTVQGRSINLVKAMKTIRFGLFQNLLHSP